MSRSSAPECCGLGAGAGCSQFSPFPSPSCVSQGSWHGMPGSHLDCGVRVGESPGMQPKGLCGAQVPSLHPEREQMFGIQLLPDLRRCTEDMESPSSPTPWSGTSLERVVGEEGKCWAWRSPRPPLSHPGPWRASSAHDAGTKQSPLPQSSDRAWNVGWDGDIRRIRGASRRWGPHRPTTFCLRTFAPAASSV